MFLYGLDSWIISLISMLHVQYRIYSISITHKEFVVCVSKTSFLTNLMSFLAAVNLPLKSIICSLILFRVNCILSFGSVTSLLNAAKR